MGQKVSYSVRLRPSLMKQLKHLAVENDLTVSEMLEEAIEELLKKYIKSGKAKQ